MSVAEIKDRDMEHFQTEFQKVHKEIAKVIVGYSDVIDDILMTILARGHPLLEAQLDRFFIKVKMGFPEIENIHTILDRTTSLVNPSVERVWSAEKILELRETVLSVPISEKVQDYAIRIVMATQPTTDVAPALTKQYLRYGASPRGAQAIVVGAKVRALLAGRSHVTPSDVRYVVLPALRHRVILNFEGEAERIDPDKI